MARLGSELEAPTEHEAPVLSTRAVERKTHSTAVQVASSEDPTRAQTPPVDADNQLEEDCQLFRQTAMPSPKKQQQFQQQNYVATYFSIDVECVATGNEHNARDVAQIALVDQFERCLLNVYVKPPEGKKVHSYLTPLTGITEDVLSAHGVPLEDAMQHVRAALPPHAVLVGQNIAKDVEWLRLEEGKDFTSLVDLAGVW